MNRVVKACSSSRRHWESLFVRFVCSMSWKLHVRLHEPWRGLLWLDMYCWVVTAVGQHVRV